MWSSLNFAKFPQFCKVCEVFRNSLSFAEFAKIHENCWVLQSFREWVQQHFAKFLYSKFIVQSYRYKWPQLAIFLSWYLCKKAQTDVISCSACNVKKIFLFVWWITLFTKLYKTSTNTKKSTPFHTHHKIFPNRRFSGYSNENISSSLNLLKYYGHRRYIDTVHTLKIQVMWEQHNKCISDRSTKSLNFYQFLHDTLFLSGWLINMFILKDKDNNTC